MIDVKAASLFPEFVRPNTRREYETRKQQMDCASTNQNQQENKHRGN